MSKIIVQSLTQLYKLIEKIEGYESDLKTVVGYSQGYYEAESLYPAPGIVLEKYKDFKFIEEKFESEDKLLSAIQFKFKNLRDGYRQELGVRYLEEGITREERLNILDKINRLEVELMPEEESNVINAKDFKLKEHYEKRKNKSGGILTNIPEIDDVTGGISDGKIVVIGAKPGNGKTSLAINMGYMSCLEPDNNTLFMTFELPKDECLMKIVKRSSYGKKIDISVLKMLKGKMDSLEEEEFFKYEQEMYDSFKSELILFDTDDANFNSLFQFKNQLLTLIERHNIRTIFLDYIQILEQYKTRDYSNKSEFLNAVVGVFRDISVRKNVRFILLSQMTKESQKNTDKEKNLGRYKMADIMEVSNLINFAYYIITLYMNDDLKMGQQILVQLLKHRDGETREEPFKTFIKHNYFLIGDMGNEFAFSGITVDNESSSSDADYIDLFNS
jgi:replicative DNA helicase